MKRIHEEMIRPGHLIVASYHVRLVPAQGGYNVELRGHDICFDDAEQLDASSSIRVAAPQIVLGGDRRLRLGSLIDVPDRLLGRLCPKLDAAAGRG